MQNTDTLYFFDSLFIKLFTFFLSYNLMIHNCFLYSFFINFFIPYVTLMSVETIHLSFKWTGELFICVFVLHFLRYITLEVDVSSSDPHFDLCFLFFWNNPLVCPSIWPIVYLFSEILDPFRNIVIHSLWYFI